MYLNRSLYLFRLALTCLLLLSDSIVNARFQMNGPVLTLTLRDALEETIAPDPSPTAKWFHLANLKPNLSWTVSSRGKPLPNWVPSWQSWSLTASYNHYHGNQKKLPFVQGTASLYLSSIDANLQIQPIWNLSTKAKTYLVQLQKGSCQLLAKVANQGLATIKGCWFSDDLPLQGIGGIKITPQLDLQRQQPSCLLEATTRSQRTKTCLLLEHQNPTLKIVHALDERHVIAPEISLYNAKITYQWDITLNSGSIRTLVDPTKAILMTWTDRTDTGKWMTSVRLPLVGTTWNQLAGDVRVQRQFQF